MRLKGWIAPLTAMAVVAGCGDQAPDAGRSESMAMPAEAKSGSGTGTITALDASAGTVTLDHQAIPAVGWPAMTMTFNADPALLAGFTEGDKVAFDVTVEGSAGTITALRAN